MSVLVRSTMESKYWWEGVFEVPPCSEDRLQESMEKFLEIGPLQQPGGADFSRWPSSCSSRVLGGRILENNFRDGLKIS